MRTAHEIGCVYSSITCAFLAILSAGLVCPHATAAGLFRDGASASSMAMGGTTTANAEGPSDALLSNPATLSLIPEPTLDLTAGGGFVHGDFSNRSNNDNILNDAGAFGSGAFVFPVGPVRLAIGINPDMALRARWRYSDTPGGLGGTTTYGVQPQESEIMLLRSSFGASWQVIPTLSLGASVGLLYNQNELNATYIFQTQPVLRSAKTMLDLNTSGLGFDIQGGVLWKPIPVLSFGASYTTRSRIATDGSASGNVNAQFASLGLKGVQTTFDYDATVVNVFPQQVSTGVAWQTTPKLLLSGQMDWINWSNAFDTLAVRLRNGNNPVLNELLHSKSLNDNVPLGWNDQFVWRFGVEYAIDSHWVVRGGYAFALNPVPPDTLTPMTAAITENTLTAGVGYHTGKLKIDLAYQWALPNTVHVSQSALQSGEYSNSSVRVTEQWVGLTTTVAF